MNQLKTQASSVTRMGSLAGIAAVSAAALVLTWAWPAGSQTRPGAVQGHVTIKKSGKRLGNLSGVVVSLLGVPNKRPAKMTAKVSQRDKQFTPSLTVVTKGSKVEFPNEDKIFHNVFSVSRAARFDLGLYKSGTSKTVKVRRAGVVDVYCNIHPDMVSKIKVVDTKYYAVTDKRGRFKIQGVPPGTYPIEAWQPYGDKYIGSVTVKSGGVATVRINLRGGKKPKHHLRKDGTPYGRYQ